MRDDITSENWWNAFRPDADELLDRLCPLIDDGMLHDIAEADYGTDAAKHLPPLKQFRDNRIIPVLDWHPAEVLELIRWSQPEDPNWKPGSTGRICFGPLPARRCCGHMRIRLILIDG